MIAVIVLRICFLGNWRQNLMFSKHCKVTIISQCLVVVCIENNVSNLFSGVSKQCLTLIFFSVNSTNPKKQGKKCGKGRTTFADIWISHDFRKKREWPAWLLILGDDNIITITLCTKLISYVLTELQQVQLRIENVTGWNDT